MVSPMRLAVVSELVEAGSMAASENQMTSMAQGAEETAMVG